jgi:hypothetical protein
MKTDFDFSNQYLVGPVVFRPDFNAKAEALTVTQAWSLFFTAGQEDKVLGLSAEAGQFFTNLLLAAGTAGILWSFVFRSVI